MKTIAKGIDEEVVAAISAAVMMMVPQESKVVAVRIKRSDVWTICGRRDLM